MRASILVPLLLVAVPLVGLAVVSSGSKPKLIRLFKGHSYRYTVEIVEPFPDAHTNADFLAGMLKGLQLTGARHVAVAKGPPITAVYDREATADTEIEIGKTYGIQTPEMQLQFKVVNVVEQAEG